jgi:Family of unknown function (DUF5762)
MVHPTDGSGYAGPIPTTDPTEHKTSVHVPTSDDERDHHKKKHRRSKFWLDDPGVLFRRFCLIPKRGNSLNENLNCLTILVVVIAVVLLLLNFPNNYVLLGALLLLVIIATIAQTCGGDDKEGFARDPHYVSGDDFIQTNVTPLVAEEWQFNPPAYELVSAVAADGRDPTEKVFGRGYEAIPPFAPYRQLLSRTNLMPNDEATVSLFSGGVTGARTFANDAFTRHTLASREDQTRLYKKINNRRYRSNGYDTISPFTSF